MHRSDALAGEICSCGGIVLLRQGVVKDTWARRVRRHSGEGARRVDHPDVTADIAALAGLLDGQGKFAESEPLYRARWGSSSERSGPRTMRSRSPNNLAAGHQATGRTADAERLYGRALAIKERLVGTDHPDVVDRDAFTASVFSSAEALDPASRRLL